MPNGAVDRVATRFGVVYIGIGRCRCADRVGDSGILFGVVANCCEFGAVGCLMELGLRREADPEILRFEEVIWGESLEEVLYE